MVKEINGMDRFPMHTPSVVQETQRKAEKPTTTTKNGISNRVKRRLVEPTKPLGTEEQKK